MTVDVDTIPTISVASADRDSFSAERNARGWTVFNRFGHGISCVYLSDRAVHALFVAIPGLRAAQVLPALRAVHKMDKAGGSDAEVQISAYPSPTMDQIVDALRGCRWQGASVRLPGGWVAKYEHEAPHALPGAPPWLSARRKGASLRPMCRDSLAAVLAAEYQEK